MNTPSPQQRSDFANEVARSNAQMRRFRLTAVGVKLGAIASVIVAVVLPFSLGTWPTVLTGAALGGLLGFALSAPKEGAPG